VRGREFFPRRVAGNARARRRRQVIRSSRMYLAPRPGAFAILRHRVETNVGLTYDAFSAERFLDQERVDFLLRQRVRASLLAA